MGPLSPILRSPMYLPLAPFNQKPEDRGAGAMGVSLPNREGQRMELWRTAMMVMAPSPGVVAVVPRPQVHFPYSMPLTPSMALVKENPKLSVPQLAKSIPLRCCSLGLESPSLTFCPCWDLFILGRSAKLLPLSPGTESELSRPPGPTSTRW